MRTRLTSAMAKAGMLLFRNTMRRAFASHKMRVTGGCILLIASVLLSIQSAGADAVVLPPPLGEAAVAGFHCSAPGFFIAGNIFCPQLFLGVGTTAGGDVENPDGSTSSINATASPFIGPAVKVQGNGGSAAAKVDYYAEVEAGPGVPASVRFVPMTFSASVKAVAGGSNAFSFAEASASYFFPIFACSSLSLILNGAPCVPGPSGPLSGLVPVNTQLTVELLAVGNAFPDEVSRPLPIRYSLLRTG